MIVGGCSQKEKSTKKSKFEEIVHTEGYFAFPVVKWNNLIYRITNTKVDRAKEKIGEIQKSSAEETVNTPDNYPNSKIFQFTEEGISESTLEDTQHYSIMKQFFENKNRLLHHLFN